MKQIPLNSALAAAVAAARAAGQVMRANWRRPKRVNAAEVHDIKLELDVRCQRLIERKLRAAFPQIPLLGEEGVSGDVAAEYRWVVDPIDGTVNYFFGIPHAAVSIALQAQSHSASQAAPAGNLVTRRAPHVSVAAVIYDPFTNELWTTVRGGPTRLNGQPVRVSDRAQIKDAVLAMGFSKSQANLNLSLPHMLRLSRSARKMRIMGSAALELAYVASGRLDAYIERTINLWDVAAGALLLENAGGEFYAVPAPGGKMRMCADNGRLRKQLKLATLFR